MRMCKQGFHAAAMLAALAVSGMWASSAWSEPPKVSSYRAVLAPVLPAVVRVLVDIGAPAPPLAVVERQGTRSSRPGPRAYDGSGSGVIFDAAKGLLLTNNHVIEGVSSVAVELPDGRLFRGRIRGVDPATDLALIEIPPDRLPAATLDTEDGLEVGDLVFSAGYPFGLEQTISMGIVSGLGRSSGQAYEELIQTDARINPGSSGGALIDAQGRVVGITNASYLDDLNGETRINYAIPSGLALRIARQLTDTGEVSRPAVGAEVRSLTPSIARALELGPPAGILVTAVRIGLAADRAGLKTGDIIVEIDGRPARRASQFRNAVSISDTKREVKLTVMRDRGRREMKVALDGKPKNRLNRFGAVFAPRPEAGAKGVVVVDLEPSIAGFYSDEKQTAASGLAVGDILVGINTRPIDNLAALASSGPGDEDVVLAVRRGEARILLPLEEER